MKIGIFGGTFNPVHYGHLRSAEDVREAFALDRIYFVPAARPPHKSSEEIATAEHRLSMVELAIADNPFFFASPIELERSGPSYSVDTIHHFLTTLEPSTLAFIIGSDAFREFASWKEYQEIPSLCDIIVTSRPGETNFSFEQLLPVALKEAFCYDSRVSMYRHVSGHLLTLHPIRGLAISSSMIRTIVRQGRSARYLIPSVIEAYITRQHLYQTEESPR
jgi:nicotinate-nucleotide adenylyltransferase